MMLGHGHRQTALSPVASRRSTAHGSNTAYRLDHAASAAAIFAIPSLDLAGAIANGTDILAGARRARRGFIARVQRRWGLGRWLGHETLPSFQT